MTTDRPRPTPAPTADAEAIALTVNGEPVVIAAGSSVADLLALRGVTTSMVAVERNGAIVRRAQHAEVRLAPGDRVEIVGFVGGG